MHNTKRQNIKKNSLTNAVARVHQFSHIAPDIIHRVTLTFAERNRLALSLSGNKPLGAN